VPVYSWTEVAAQLRQLAERIPPGQTMELMVFGGAALQHWGMEGRLTRDIDVQLSKSSPNLEGLMQALAPAVQFRDQPRPDQAYVEVMRSQDDFTLPDFSVAEVVEIAPNLKLLFPAPAEIAASKLAFINEPDRVQDIADVAYIEKGLGADRQDIARSVETITGESVRFWARMNLRELDKLFREIGLRRAELATRRSQRTGHSRETPPELRYPSQERGYDPGQGYER
jgi:hypothetical protein